MSKDESANLLLLGVTFLFHIVIARISNFLQESCDDRRQRDCRRKSNGRCGLEQWMGGRDTNTHIARNEQASRQFDTHTRAYTRADDQPFHPDRCHNSGMRRGLAPAVAAGTVMPIREGMYLVSHLVGSVRDSDATNLLARGAIHLSHESNLGEDGVHVDADAARIIVNIPRGRADGGAVVVVSSIRATFPPFKGAASRAGNPRGCDTQSRIEHPEGSPMNPHARPSNAATVFPAHGAARNAGLPHRKCAAVAYLTSA